ncbi:hypothetical protein CR513_31312, partial [Mucuna pruriens]
MYIGGGNDSLNYKLFPGTLRGVAMHWLATLPTCYHPFAANKVKRLEVVDLFDLRQTKGESLKCYLARFNNATGLRTDQFNNALALRRPSSMEKIRAQAEKHIKAEEDLTDRLEAECQPFAPQELKLGTSRGSKGETKYQIQPRPQASNTQAFTPLKVKKA